jgi:hypothetical protein
MKEAPLKQYLSVSDFVEAGREMQPLGVLAEAEAV